MHGTRIYRYHIIDAKQGKIIGSAFTKRQAEQRAGKLARKTGHTHCVAERLSLIRNIPKKGKK